MEKCPSNQNDDFLRYTNGEGRCDNGNTGVDMGEAGVMMGRQVGRWQGERGCKEASVDTGKAGSTLVRCSERWGLPFRFTE